MQEIQTPPSMLQENENIAEIRVLESAAFPELTGNLLSYYIFQLITIGDVRSVSSLLEKISYRKELQDFAIGLLSKFEQAGVIQLDGDSIISQKHRFRFDLKKAKDGELLTSLFAINTKAALSGFDAGRRDVVAFTISEDPETSGEISTAIEEFREKVREIGKKAVSRQATGIRFVGLVNSMMVGADYWHQEEGAAAALFATRILESAAHDLKSSLFGLKVLGTEVQSKIGGEYASLYDVTVERMQKIIHSMLEHKMKNRLPRKSTDVVAVIDRVIAEKNLLFGRRVNFVVKLECQSAHISCIPELELTRIFHNLIQNSIDAIVGDLNTVLIRVSAADGTCNILIKDTGTGIPDEVMRKIQSGGSATTKSSGHGLGLSTTIEKIKSAGGALTVDSKEGFGTEVKIALRLASN